MLIKYTFKNGKIIILNSKEIDCIYAKPNYVVCILFKSGTQLDVISHSNMNDAIETVEDLYKTLAN